MPKEQTTDLVRGCFYTLILIGKIDGHTPPKITLISSLMFESAMTSFFAVTHANKTCLCKPVIISFTQLLKPV